LKAEGNRKYYEVIRKCQKCGVKFNAKVYVFKSGYGYDFGNLCDPCSEKASAEFDKQEQEKAQSEITAQREKWRVNCGIPQKYSFKGFQHFEKTFQPSPFKKCQAYADHFPLAGPRGYPSLVLYSDHSWGTGKTHLACSIAHHILSRWAGEPRVCPVKVISERVLFGSIRETYNYSYEEKGQLPSEKNIIDSCVNVPLLILDDLGKEEVSDLRFVQRTLFSIFDGRYNAELPVVVTANLNNAGLKSHMGGNAGNEASYNRLFEMCKGEFVHMDGKSYREKLAND
jgi:DNA replication protein DnaC